MKKIKENLSTFIITLVVLLIPLMVGVILWNKLPAEIATHWGVDGNPDGYSSKAFTVFGMPLLILALHLVVSLITAIKDTNAISDKLFRVLLWICPSMSVVIGALIYATALGYQVNVLFGAMMLLGIIYIILGNYLPKARRNYFFGVRVKWTLKSKKNWENTNRFSAKVMVILGIVFIICAILELIVGMNSVATVVLICGSLVLAVVLMCGYSYFYYLKHSQDEDY